MENSEMHNMSIRKSSNATLFKPRYRMLTFKYGIISSSDDKPTFGFVFRESSI